MARIRSIHPGIASDEAFMQMSMAAKAAWPILWTECDDHGVFEWKPIVLKARIFPADNVDFAALLDELITLGCVQRFESEGKGYGIVRNFCAYQRPKHPSYRYPFPTSVETFAAFKPATEDKATVGLPQTSPRPTEKPPQMKEEVGGEEDKNAAALSAREPVDLIFEAIGVADDPHWYGHKPTVARWLDGWSLELDILPTVRRLMQGRGPPRSPKFFEGAIADAHASRTAPLPTGTARKTQHERPNENSLVAAGQRRIAELDHLIAGLEGTGAPEGADGLRDGYADVRLLPARGRG